MDLITSETLYKDDNKVTVPATFSEAALNQLRSYYKKGIEQGMHNLSEAEFIGMVAALGTLGLINGAKKENQLQRETDDIKKENVKLKEKLQKKK